MEVNEPVPIVRPDDGPIGPKHVALHVLLMIIIDVVDGNINTLFRCFGFLISYLVCCELINTM
jgi:hypothetical protein